MTENQVVKIVLIGIAGRMGISNYQLLSQIPGFEIVGGIEYDQSPFQDKTMGEVAETKNLRLSQSNFTIKKKLEDIDTPFDLVVDFSNVPSTLEHLQMTAKLVEGGKKIGWVIGTTGFNQEQIEQIKNDAKKFPIILSGNYSTGINVLINLIKAGIKSLGDDFDLEIVEHHHREKIDAPSGTANMIRDAILDEKKLTVENVVNGRDGIIGRREKDEVGMSVLRGGGVVGHHEVHFLGDDEKILISHTAFNRQAFTGGVSRAVKFLNQKIQANQTGFFEMKDVLGFNFL